MMEPCNRLRASPSATHVTMVTSAQTEVSSLSAHLTIIAMATRPTHTVSCVKMETMVSIMRQGMRVPTTALLAHRVSSALLVVKLEIVLQALSVSLVLTVTPQTTLNPKLPTLAHLVTSVKKDLSSLKSVRQPHSLSKLQQSKSQSAPYVKWVGTVPSMILYHMFVQRALSVDSHPSSQVFVRWELSNRINRKGNLTIVSHAQQDSAARRKALEIYWQESMSLPALMVTSVPRVLTSSLFLALQDLTWTMFSRKLRQSLSNRCSSVALASPMISKIATSALRVISVHEVKVSALRSHAPQATSVLKDPDIPFFAHQAGTAKAQVKAWLSLKCAQKASTVHQELLNPSNVARIRFAPRSQPVLSQED